MVFISDVQDLLAKQNWL